MHKPIQNTKPLQNKIQKSPNYKNIHFKNKKPKPLSAKCLYSTETSIIITTSLSTVALKANTLQKSFYSIKLKMLSNKYA